MSGTTGAQRFLFGEDFRRAPADAADRASREAADAEAYARGHEAGRLEAAAETERLVAIAVDGVAAGLAAGLGRMEEAERAIEEQALAFYEALARKLAGQAVADRPLAAVADAAERAFRHLRGVPHLAVRVSARLVEPVDALLSRLARERGFEGRIIVLGDEALSDGDARFEWADGGVVADRRVLEDAIAAAVQAGAASGGVEP